MEENGVEVVYVRAVFKELCGSISLMLCPPSFFEVF